ncbi:hypothetical protein [Helicobacter suis]|uniref:hypothetical protein n=1 Tax=Helicobacter suis TaxID=104628 RepID=UPI0013D12AFC|nr:hypothetical protein [Helicobacter suis]
MKIKWFFISILSGVLVMGCTKTASAANCSNKKPTVAKGLAQQAPADQCPNDGEPKQVE